jgi:hypothetical protein
MTDWLSKEISKIKDENKYIDSHPLYKKELDNKIFYRFMLLLFCFGCFYVVQCEGAVVVKDLVLEWICPGCGYDNCTGIRYCGLCGGEG